MPGATLQAHTITIERRTAAFYAVLLALVVLDLILMFWILNPFTRFGAAEPPHRPVQDTTKVDDTGKPSAFELTSWKAALNHPRTRQAKLKRAPLVASRQR